MKSKGKGVVRGRGRGRTRSTLINPTCNMTPPINSVIRNNQIFLVNCLFGPADNPSQGAYVQIDANITYQPESCSSSRIGKLYVNSDIG